LSFIKMAAEFPDEWPAQIQRICAGLSSFMENGSCYLTPW
jgi:hypothetical protein